MTNRQYKTKIRSFQTIESLSRGCTIKELARDLNCTRRTAYRYLEAATQFYRIRSRKKGNCVVHRIDGRKGE